MVRLGNAAQVPTDCKFAGVLKLMEVGEKQKSGTCEQVGIGKEGSRVLLLSFLKFPKKLLC